MSIYFSCFVQHQRHTCLALRPSAPRPAARTPFSIVAQRRVRKTQQVAASSSAHTADRPAVSLRFEIMCRHLLRSAGALGGSAVRCSPSCQCDVLQVILTADVPGLGQKGELKKAVNGYFRNYLLPQRLAVPATDGILRCAITLCRTT